MPLPRELQGLGNENEEISKTKVPLLQIMGQEILFWFSFLLILCTCCFRTWKFLNTEKSVWALVVVVRNLPMTCRWCRTCRHHGEGCALVSWDENWCVWWEYPSGAKGNETPASGWFGSTLYTACLGYCTQIPEEGYDTQKMQAGTQKNWKVSLIPNQKISIQTLTVSYSAL